MKKPTSMQFYPSWAEAVAFDEHSILRFKFHQDRSTTIHRNDQLEYQERILKRSTRSIWPTLQPRLTQPYAVRTIPYACYGFDIVFKKHSRARTEQQNLILPLTAMVEPPGSALPGLPKATKEPRQASLVASAWFLF